MESHNEETPEDGRDRDGGAPPDGELRFATVKGGGYRIDAVKEHMDGVIAKVGDPHRGWQAVPPYFPMSRRWGQGWVAEEVDAHVERRRAEPADFTAALRLLLAREGVTVLPGHGPLVGELKARRWGGKDTVAFTQTHLELESSTGRMSIPYSEVGNVVLDTSEKEVDSGAATDLTVSVDSSLLHITQVTHGQRTLEFREYAPAPVGKTLRSFQLAIAGLRTRHPEWSRMEP
ncbi:hypothetical protein ACPCA8_13715 [Streptomyces capoamus]|uniref:hypothetical protein n=1 Tax=Streptomyces capoamus TaxID=68183 RepID=UPI003C2E52A6